ncbi:MAG: glutathione S-transferase [Rhodospirillaceae bacterium]|nr:glutathione S-transferase [Rhodospirillaceae bacterium]MBT6084444.1 glutathione S-transferase [Rhodospirillaceae bacterium]MBT7249153.1 glutathione S-transferase [Rhodospirillaceae bacterium]
MRTEKVGFEIVQYKLLLGNQVYSGWSLRFGLVFRHFNIDFEHQVVPLYTNEFEQFRKQYFPARQLPALITDEDGDRQVIWDSLSIVEFLSDHHPKLEIWPSDPGMRAAARSLCAEMHSAFKALRSSMPVNLKRNYAAFQPNEEVRSDIQRICALWRWVRELFVSDGPYLFGDTLSAVDAFFAPVASRFRTYSIDLDEQSAAYSNLLLQHPATLEFIEAAQSESWRMEHNEFDLD